VESAVLDFAFEQSTYGQLRVSNELRKRGVFVSPGGVLSIWLRHDLTTFKGRLAAQDTYYVGNIEGVGRIYQQTFAGFFRAMTMFSHLVFLPHLHNFYDRL